MGSIQTLSKEDLATKLPRAAKKVVENLSGCWEWTAFIAYNGYGQIGSAEFGARYAHRVVYEALVGPIPEGLDLDHLCRNRRCVNPAHLEPVTRSVNMIRARKPLCRNGHKRSDENNYGKLGRYVCRRCVLDNQKKHRDAAKA